MSAHVGTDTDVPQGGEVAPASEYVETCRVEGERRPTDAPAVCAGCQHAPIRDVERRGPARRTFALDEVIVFYIWTLEHAFGEEEQPIA